VTREVSSLSHYRMVRLTMTTDLREVSARKHKKQAQTQTDITIALVCVVVCLVVLVMLFADQSFAKATIEWECLF
jgi:signal transduction histidine kinase